MKSNSIRKYSRRVHRYLSFLFAGVTMVYAISGLTMNHLKDFNPKYVITQTDYTIGGNFPRKVKSYDKNEVLALLQTVDKKADYVKHYYPNQSTMKVFLKSGSSLTLNLNNGSAKYEKIEKRPFFSQLSFLHYNPGAWWTVFSDVFAVSLIIISITGLIIVKGKKGITGTGGILFVIGLLIPILFLLFL